MSEKIYRGIDLLDKIIELQDLSPSPEEWDEKVLFSNEPRYYRFLVIKSLIKAFYGDKTKAEDFLDGDFINNSDSKIIEVLIVKMNEFMVLNTNRSILYDRVGNPELLNVYEKLLKYKTILFKLKNINSGVMVMSLGIYQFPILLTESISKNIDHKSLDDFLELFINPENKSFTEKELIENYGFPEVDLDEIDFDWF